MDPKPPRLLDQLRDRIRLKHYSLRTEQTYAYWVRRFILFHGKRHPRELGAHEVEAFLTHLAVERRCSASTQNQAKSALLFLYKEVLGVELPWLDGVESAKVPHRLPVVLTRTEVDQLLAAILAVEAAEFATVARRLHLCGEGFRRSERDSRVFAAVEDDRGWPVPSDLMSGRELFRFCTHSFFGDARAEAFDIKPLHWG